MADDRDQAWQEPTAARLQRAEQAGEFARSRELATALVWLGGLALLITCGGTLAGQLAAWAVGNWSTPAHPGEATALVTQQWSLAQSLFWQALLPILGGLVAVAVLAHWMQGRFGIWPHLVSPDVGRLLPHRNAGRLLGGPNLVSLVTGVVRFVLLSSVAVWIVVGDWQSLVLLNQQSLPQASTSLATWLGSVTLRLCAAAIAVGVADYGIRWWLHRRSMRMTEQEIRDEHRATEPAPQVTARRRVLTRQDQSQGQAE